MSFLKRYLDTNRVLIKISSKDYGMNRSAIRKKPAAWKQKLMARIPQKVRTSLEEAFVTAFNLIFRLGHGLIVKGLRQVDLQAAWEENENAVRLHGIKKEFGKLRTRSTLSHMKNMFTTTAEGLFLGALGLGVPDLALFLGTLLKGIYETAQHYHFDYTTPHEQMLILKMMQTAMSTKMDFVNGNKEIKALFQSEPVEYTDEELKCQIRKTASVFALDMLLMKSVQGVPVIGILGGAANPVYYHKVMKYVELKYRMRYLETHKNGILEAHRRIVEAYTR